MCAQEEADCRERLAHLRHGFGKTGSTSKVGGEGDEGCDQKKAVAQAAAEAARQKRPSNGNRRRSAEAIQRRRATKSATQKAKKDAAEDRPSAANFGLTPGLPTVAAQQREKLKKGN